MAHVTDLGSALLQAIGEGDEQALSALLAADFVASGPGDPRLGGVFTASTSGELIAAAAALRNEWTKIAFTVERTVDGGEHGALAGKLNGTRSDGTEVAARFACLVTTAGDTVRQLDGVVDTAPLARQSLLDDEFVTPDDGEIRKPS